MNLIELPITLEQEVIERLHRVCEYEHITFDQLVNRILKNELKDVLFIKVPD